MPTVLPTSLLINPNGIIFGPNASLNIGGSFLASTANAIGFGERGFFSATNPESPSSLLTVNPSALLFNQIQTASIQNNSVAPSGLDPSSRFTATGLRVPDGKSLLLVGGDINMNGGGLYAFGGRVQLGGSSGAGMIGLNGNGNNLSLSFPDRVARNDVFLSNGAGVDVTAGDGGSIAVNAQNLEMTGSSSLSTGIGSRLGSNNSKAGNIDINVTGAINLNESFIQNQVLAEASGQGGDINISASTLQAKGGAQVITATFGSGKGGNLRIDAQDVQLIGTGTDSQFNSSLAAFAQPNSTGNAGDLTIRTDTLLVRDRAQVFTTTFGSGKGGNLTVDAKDMQLIGTSADGQISSGLFSYTQPNSTGDAGDLAIKTNTLLVKDGAQVTASAYGGSGKGGNLTITADKVQVIGTSIKGRPSRLDSDTIEGTGNAGELMINTSELLIQNGAQVSAATYDNGKGGNLTVTADKVLLFNSSPADSRFNSLSVQNERGAGDAGNLTIKTGELLVRDGSQISAATFGGGKSGNLTVNADKMQLIGITADGKFPSGLAASTNRGATGDAGNLTINTGGLLIQDGAQVSVGTSGSGKGGNLTVTADKVQLIGRSTTNVRLASGLFASTNRGATGDAGDLTINTGELLIKDGAEVTVSSLGGGVVGNLGITANLARLENGYITAQTRSGNGGNLKLNIADLLLLRRGSEISTTAGTAQAGGNGGNINIDAPNGFIVAKARENSDISANAYSGSGGRVTINAAGIFSIAPLSRQELERLRPEDLDPSKLPTNDITAISQTNPFLSGTIGLNTPDVDPSRGFVNLPAVPVDTKVAQGCTASGSQAQSEFIITGRSGLPPNPGDALSTDAVMVDLITLNPKVENRSSPTVSIEPTNPQPAPIVPASGWVFNNGQVTLTALAPNVPASIGSNRVPCHAAQQ